MTLRHLGDRYEFESANRVENYHGAINLYVAWEEHLLFVCPFAFPVPGEMIFRDFLEQALHPAIAAHPDAEHVVWEQTEWTRDGEPWQPRFDDSLLDNGVDHMTFLRFRTPQLRGLGGAGI